MNALLILNESAGSLSGEKDAVSAGAVLEALAAAGVRAELRLAGSGGMTAALTAAAAAQPEALLIGGGDGSVNAAAACIVDTNIALGVLPLGTFNHFARDLGLAPMWRDAVEQIARGHRRKIDVGEVNGRLFINNCSIGSYPEAVRRRDALRKERGTGKWWAMILASITVFRRLRRLRLQVEMQGRTINMRTPFMMVGNNAYSGHLFGEYLRPRLDEGRLWIYTTRAHRRLTIARLAWQSFIRSIDAADALDSHSATEATVTTSDYEGRVPLALDGELVDVRPPLRFRSRPGALTVIVPAPAPSAKL